MYKLAKTLSTIYSDEFSKQNFFHRIYKVFMHYIYEMRDLFGIGKE